MFKSFSIPQSARSLPSVKVPTYLRQLNRHLSQTERVTLSWLLLLLVLSGVWSIIAYINANTELIPQSGGTYREAAVGQPHYLNPILAGASEMDQDITRLVYSSLFKFDSNLEIQPDLATRYELSENDTKYTIYLRSDARWHDGETVTADDVVFTLASIQTPEYGSPLRDAFQGVTVEKIDDHTLSLKLKNPYAPFLASLTVGIMPEHVWANIPPKNAALAEQMLKPVGSGPYQFAESKTRRKTGEITELSLIRNEGYYGPRQYIDNITFYFYSTHEEAVKALTSGQVDGIGFLPLQLHDDVADRSSLSLHRLKMPQYFGLFFNPTHNPVLNDAGIRNALALATDRQTVVEEALRGEGEPLHLPIPLDTFAFNEEIGAPTYDPEKAKQNLEDAGWKDVDGDGVREKDDQRLHLTITTTDWPEYVRTAELVQEQWQKIGVETQIQHYGAGTIQQTVIRPRDYEILLYGEILPAIPDPYPFWHSTQTRTPGLNFAMFKDERVDKILEEARKTLDPGMRSEKYKEFQGIIMDLKPAIILYRPYYLFATKDNVRGVNANKAAITSGRFNNIEQWHVRTKRVWK